MSSSGTIRLASILSLLLILSCSSVPAPSQPVRVLIVGTTDIHGWLDGRELVPAGGGKPVRFGGLSVFASYMEALRASNGGRVILVDSGDIFQGTLESNLFEGEAMILAFNALGYSAAAVGNHEFDFGPVGPAPVAREASDDPLGALKRNARLAAFPFLSANMTEKGSGATPGWVKKSVIVESGGAKIGIIGLSTPSTPEVTMRANVATLDFGDPVAATLAAAQDLRRRGADAVIVTAHMGGRCSNVTDERDPSSCEPQQEAYRFVTALPPGTIDGYFGGHTHSQMRHVIAGVPVLQALPHLRAFSTLELYVDVTKGSVDQARTRLRPHTMVCREVYEGTESCDPREAPAGATLVPRRFENQPVQPVAKVTAILEPFLAKVAAIRNEPLGVRAATTFTHTSAKESPLGGLIADIMRAEAGADFALVNSGGIRSELRAGDITYGDIFAVSPFDNYTATVQMTGAQVVETVRLMTSGAHGLAQVSGLRYTIDVSKEADKPPDERNRLTSIRQANGEEIDPAKIYKVAMTDFLVGGGDGLTRLIGTIPKERVMIHLDRPTLRDVIAAALKRRAGGEPLTPSVDGRVTVVGVKAK